MAKLPWYMKTNRERTKITVHWFWVLWQIYKYRLRILFPAFALFTTGFIQVYFVSVNTYFLAKEIYLGVFVAAFMISLIWSFNVKRIAFGSTADRLIYATGATLGSLFGLWSSSYIIHIIS